MRRGAAVSVIIPALNEEGAIGKVLAAIPEWVDDVIVADNGSTDRTADVAREHGARVVTEPHLGYGSACLCGIAALRRPDVVVFLDADFSDHPDEMALLVDPIVADEADLVIGSRVRGERERGALTPQARWGNWLACGLMRLFWRVRYTDLGPFRAIRAASLARLGMCDRDFGWTVEMQIKAAQRGLRGWEVPVSYRKRVGKSKISGTARGVVLAGTKILWTLFRSALSAPRAARPERVVVFTRWPEPGTTKTRLIPALGAAGAADLQRRMTELMVARALSLATERGAGVEVRHEGGTRREMTRWLGPQPHCVPQGGGDLGERMRRAVLRALRDGVQRVLVVGTDCPDLTAERMSEALDALHAGPLVLGPASDGGYYLIGLTQDAPELFADMPWGTGDVLDKSLARARAAGLEATLLDSLDDVDRPGDLPVWKRWAAGLRGTKVSVIIPALNEAANLPDTLESVSSCPVHEIIVADGGSTDETVAIARSHGARVVETTASRAGQMNAGAQAATGDVLLFLHGDTRLPQDYTFHMLRGLSARGVVGGAFGFKVDAPNPGLRLVEWVTGLRSRYLQMPYGDQGIFVWADVFREVGGYPEQPIMEDFVLVRRLRRRGRVVTLKVSAVTSGRRWRRLGVFRTTLINQSVIVGHVLGVSPERLARWYGRGRG